MKSLRYIEGVATVAVDKDKCVGCSMCLAVCPHEVFALVDKKAAIQESRWLYGMWSVCHELPG